MISSKEDTALSFRRRKTKQNAISNILHVPEGVDDNDVVDLPRAPDSNPEDDDRRQRRPRRKRRKKRLQNDDEEESFLCLFLRTGTVIAFLWLGSWSIYRHFVPFVDVTTTSTTTTADEDDYFKPPVPILSQPDAQRTSAISKESSINTNPEDLAPPTIPPLPAVNLSQRAQFWDAFAIAAWIQNRTVTSVNTKSFWTEAQAIRRDFVDLYGNEANARALLDRGLTLYNNDNNNDNNNNDKNQKDDVPGSSSTLRMPRDLQHTACRLKRAKEENRPFRISFGGYSVTTGRGNYFHQSYPKVLEGILSDVVTEAGLGLQMINAAIGGCPSFPYGWCLPNFLGNAPDVVSWDFAMNEAGGDPQGLEAYIRRVWHDLGATNSDNALGPPQLIVRDTYLAAERRQLLQNYSEWFPDAITLHSDTAAAPFLKLPDAYRPVGFANWRQFGAPKGSPGQALHHPAVAEHLLMAYLLSMHYLAALEILVLQEELDSRDTNERYVLSCPSDVAKPTLPNPWTWTAASTENQPWHSVMVGDSSRDWSMTDIRCRTSFEPIANGELTSLVVSGSTGEDLDILKPRSKMFYNSGWTLDLAHDEKQVKLNLLRYGGLGFIDSKKAYYGIEMSGWLRLLLPFEGKEEVKPKKGDRALDRFLSVVLCEVNDKTTTGRVDKGVRCKFDEDVEYMVGGVNATDLVQPITAGGALYLGKKVCLRIPVPSTAQITSADDLFDVAAREKRAKIAEFNQNHVSSRQQVFDPAMQGPAHHGVGLSVEIRVHNPHIIQVEQACSVAHVIWEQAPMEEK